MTQREQFLTLPGLKHQPLAMQTELHEVLMVKLPLCLVTHHAMKAYWESEGIAPPFSTLALVLKPRGNVVVKALDYKPEGRSFEIR
jgi:hypothetical protein